MLSLIVRDARVVEARAEDVYVADGITVLVSGRCFPIDAPEDAQPMDARAVFAVFRQAGEQMTASVRGLYTIVVFRDDECAYIFQDRFGAGRGLYWTYDGTLYIGDTIKSILARMPAPRVWDEPAVEHFIQFGAPHSAHTLVKGVHRLPSGCYAVIAAASGAVRYRRARFASPKSDIPTTPCAYAEMFDKAIIACGATDPVCCTLSSGYDTNLILYALARTRRDVRAFCVGGARGVDETAVAMDIASAYQDVACITARVDEDTLAHLPDIVFRLEGAVYEWGVFLQYELAKLARDAGARALVLGEGADQVMDIAASPWLDRALTRVSAWLPPRAMLTQIILPKSVMMLSSFGIEGRYPFLEETFLRVARRLRWYNGAGKYFHKDAVHRLLPEAVRPLLQKCGGATSVLALFPDEKARARFCAACTALPAHDPARKISRRKTATETETDYCLRLAYLHVFEQVFLSGAYDERFATKSLDVPLSAFLNTHVHAPRPIAAPHALRSRTLYNRASRLATYTLFRLRCPDARHVRI